MPKISSRIVFSLLLALVGVSPALAEGIWPRPVTQDVFIDIPLDHLVLEGLKRMDEEGEPEE